MRKVASISLVLVLLFAACSDASDGSEGELSQAAPPGDAKAEADRTPDRPSASKRPAKQRRPRTSSPGDRGAGGDADTSDGATDENTKGKTNDDAEPFDDGNGDDEEPSALHPAAGRYVYGQSGYERFCQAASCDQRALPARQPVVVRLADRGRDRAVVVSKMHSSDSRTLTTRTTFTRRNALITDVVARFSYEGFAFENSYEPRPPVQSLRFPLKRGSGWSGSWEDSTSGDYSVNVLGRDTVQVRDAAVRAYKLATVTEFRGEFTGSSKAIVWVDAATKTVIKTSGKVDLRSSFGRFISEFNTSLRSGPRYR